MTVLTHLGAFVLGLFVARYVLLRRWAKIESDIEDLRDRIYLATERLLEEE